MLSSANLRFTYFSEIYFTQNVCLTYGWDGKIGSFLLPEKVLISESHICFCNVAKKKKKKSLAGTLVYLQQMDRTRNPDAKILTILSLVQNTH